MTAHRFDPSLEVSEEQRNKTLQELEGEDWGEPDFPSHLAQTCHALRRKPLREFTVEDLRIMIGQHFSLNYLMPLAIEQLRRDPLVEGDFYPGDLLYAVLRAESGFWQARPQIRVVIQEIVYQVTPLPENLHVPTGLRQALLAFQQP